MSGETKTATEVLNAMLNEKNTIVRHQENEITGLKNRLLCEMKDADEYRKSITILRARISLQGDTIIDLHNLLKTNIGGQP
jgi:hypothetical protein